MTRPTTPDPAAPPQFKSAASGRTVVPGWTNLVPGKADTIEVQLDLNAADLEREHACLLVEYWPNDRDLTLQSILPVRAFSAAPEGWCLFIPSQGRVLIRAIDPQPNPPVLASHWLNIEPDTRVGTVVTVSVSFPGAAEGQSDSGN